MIVQPTNVPLKVIIGLTPLASILVKFAKTLQVAPSDNIKLAVNVPFD